MTKQERWQVEGNSAEFYERYVSLLMEPWVQGLVELAEIQPDDRVLDVGCGPGFVARRAAELVGKTGRVVGLDLNESMLIKARETPRLESAVTVEWRQGDAQSMPFDDSSFDVVLVLQALQFCPEPAVALREMRRVLAPGGSLVVCAWGPLEDNPYPVAQINIMEPHVGAAVRTSLAAAHSLGNAEELRNLFNCANFSHVEIRSEIRETPVGPAKEFFQGHFAALPYANAIAALSDDTLKTMLSESILELDDYVVEGILEFPTGAHLVAASV